MDILVLFYEFTRFARQICDNDNVGTICVLCFMKRQHNQNLYILVVYVNLFHRILVISSEGKCDLCHLKSMYCDSQGVPVCWHGPSFHTLSSQLSWSAALTCSMTGGDSDSRKQIPYHRELEFKPRPNFKNPSSSHSATLLFKFMAKPSL